jgi:hypothetical protein
MGSVHHYVPSLCKVTALVGLPDHYPLYASCHTELTSTRNPTQFCQCQPVSLRLLKQRCSQASDEPGLYRLSHRAKLVCLPISNRARLAGEIVVFLRGGLALEAAERQSYPSVLLLGTRDCFPQARPLNGGPLATCPSKKASRFLNRDEGSTLQLGRCL